MLPSASSSSPILFQPLCVRPLLSILSDKPPVASNNAPRVEWQQPLWRLGRCCRFPAAAVATPALTNPLVASHRLSIIAFFFTRKKERERRRKGYRRLLKTPSSSLTATPLQRRIARQLTPLRWGGCPQTVAADAKRVAGLLNPNASSHNRRTHTPLAPATELDASASHLLPSLLRLSQAVPCRLSCEALSSHVSI